MKEIANREQVQTCPHCGYDLAHVQAASHQLQPFTILRGKYMVGKVIGEGGFGITYLGFDLNLDMRVAIKEFYPNGFVTRESMHETKLTIYAGNNQKDIIKWRDGFIKEARSLAKFAGLSGIVQVLDFFNENETAYIVMEYVDGITLKSYLKQNGGRIPAGQVLQMMDPVIRSLAKVHETGIIHRDISPDNIMMTKEGNMKLLDFGAARDVTGNAEKSLSVMLKPGYAPEEQYRSHGNQGTWSDVYALCATIYKCITGTTPVESMERMRSDTLRRPNELGAGLSQMQEDALMAGMAVYAEQRIQNMTDLYNMLYQGTPVPQTQFGTGGQMQQGMGGQMQYGAGSQVQYGTGGQTQYGMGGQVQYGTGGQTQYGMGGQTQYGAGGQTQYGMGGQTQYGAAGQSQNDAGEPAKPKNKAPIILGVGVGAVAVLVIALIVVLVSGSGKSGKNDMQASTGGGGGGGSESGSSSAPVQDIGDISALESAQTGETQEYIGEDIKAGDRYREQGDYISAFNSYLAVEESDFDYAVAYARIESTLDEYITHEKDSARDLVSQENVENYKQALEKLDEANDIVMQILDYYPEHKELYGEELPYVTAEIEMSMGQYAVDKSKVDLNSGDYASAEDVLINVKNYLMDRPESEYDEQYIPGFIKNYHEAYAQMAIMRSIYQQNEGMDNGAIAEYLRSAFEDSDYHCYVIELFEHYANDAGVFYKVEQVNWPSDYILPSSDSEELTEEDLYGLSRSEIRLARYEIYARHNRKFSDPSVSQYFYGKGWYSEQWEAGSFDETSLSDIEKNNVRVICEYEIDKGYMN